MAYSHLDPSTFHSNASESSSLSAPRNAPELKVYQFFILSVPILLTFVVLSVLYWYLRRRMATDSSSVHQMRTSLDDNNNIPSSETGLKKEVREMLPVVVYKESFCVTDIQCSVCLGEYKTEERLHQIPTCGHMFHMDCVDNWLATHTTCPLCRRSVLSPPATTPKPQLGNQAVALQHMSLQETAEPQFVIEEPS